jgi:hypothetical protein
MESRLSETTRWCPVCEDRGIPVIWGYPTAEHEQLADQGRVILAGCVVAGMRPSHVCGNCACEFIASDRIYQREHAGRDIYGVGVWPHGRRSVRIEANDQGWAVMIAEEGSMLIDRHALMVIPQDVFEDMWPWEVEEWASRRGFGVEARPADEGWILEVGEGGGFFELVLIKTWWRSLGRNPVKTAIDRLSCEVSSPVWLPE